MHINGATASICRIRTSSFDAVIDTVAAQIVDRIDTDRPVSCITVSLDGTRLYVADYDGAITAMELAKADRELRAAS